MRGCHPLEPTSYPAPIPWTQVPLMPRVLCTPSILFHVDGPYKKILEGAGLEVVYPPENAKLMDPAVLIENLKGIDAVAASVEPYSAEVLSKSKLRAIARLGVGYDA